MSMCNSSSVRTARQHCAAFLGTIVLAGIVFCAPATAQEHTGPTLDGPDTESGEVDLSFLNDEPAGQFIADYALQYLYHPYVSGGNDPGGFDCAGLAWWVVINTTGIDMGTGVSGQINFGYWVDWGAWQPGDLLFFAGTYRAGISHVGIYIGDGQFVHAENWDTDVTISSVYSNYYAGHYYGAKRLV